MNNFAWDFDRPTAEWMKQFDTFSVGIFQWLKKAAGNELKKSKAISRVLGYTAEPDRVFDKALEICARLNREAATAQSPPSWLQKQYSVPRPDDMVVVRLSDDFTGAQVRAMRIKVMKELLLPAKFVAGKDSSYVRRQEDQIHLINFQAAQYGHRFTINLGLHYAFIPPLFHCKPLRLTDLHQLDCIWRSRIGGFLPTRQESWFEYGKDRDQLIANLRLCATTSLNFFQEYSERWRDPAAFLDVDAQWDRTDVALGWIDVKMGKSAVAKKRLERSKKHDPDNCELHLLLSELLEEYGKLGKTAAKKMQWKDWFL